MLLPGPGQGSSYIYHAYTAPFLRRHEKRIEDAIKDAHDVVKSIPGVEFALQHSAEIWAYVMQRVFGKDVRRQRSLEEEVRHAPPSANTYVASLLGRFIAPEAESSGAASAGAGAAGMAGLLSTALSQASNLAAAGGNRSMSGGAVRGEPLIPEHLGSDKERLSYITGQRDRLRSLLSAYEKEEETIHLAAGAGTKGRVDNSMGRSKSEHEFETIGSEDVGDEGRTGNERRTSKGGWAGWVFGNKEGDAKSSGVDTGR